MKNKKLNVLFVCGYGVGTSVIMENNVRNGLAKFNFEVNMNHSSAGEANSYKDWADIICISKKLVDTIDIPQGSGTHVVEIVNLMQGDVIAGQIMDVVKEFFPEYL